MKINKNQLKHTCSSCHNKRNQKRKKGRITREKEKIKMTNWGNQKDVTALKSEDKPKKCPDCGGKIVFEEGELVCKVCGLVVE